MITRVLGGALRLLPTLIFGIARLAVVAVTYVATALASAASGAVVGLLVADAPTAAVAAFLGLLVAPVALTFGMLAWLIPVSLRLSREGRDPEFEWLVPSGTDAVWFVLAAACVAAAPGVCLAGPWFGLAYAVVTVPGTLTIAMTGGSQVAELWLALLLQSEH
ncbi:MAG: hypothetical protein EP330_05720 [Deltaproteobacteria bacterium]|nr:MAG: hypothetical protein EP330_05720 [Deltaproteobacteria bacterium]